MIRDEIARALLQEMVALAEFWINREDTRGKSESEYRTWLALGHHSNALRNARNVLKGGA